VYFETLVRLRVKGDNVVAAMMLMHACWVQPFFFVRLVFDRCNAWFCSCRKVLQEPCVVFAAHFSLRMGPAAHLLHCWRQNPLCLLILTEVICGLNCFDDLFSSVLSLPLSCEFKEIIF